MSLEELFNFGTEKAGVPELGEVALAMGISLVLNVFIANIYRLTYKGTRYSQDYVQTLIIIGVVTTILIMVVAGNGAIAFGMFAAFASAIASRSRGFISASPPPILAATIIALEHLLHTLPRLLSITAFLCLIPAQCE